jgi:RNase P/RNase MRP subunit POP5
VEVKEQYKISNRFAALENLDDVDISKAWKSIRENIRASAAKNLGYYELKEQKPWLDEVFKIVRSKEGG